jgi:GTP-binding protein Era
LTTGLSSAFAYLAFRAILGRDGAVGPGRSGLAPGPGILYSAPIIKKQDTPMNTRAGFVALIGEPNAGKSTLLNRMVGAKVSIVTHKVQTTRARIRGIAMAGETQIVFVDTPGLFRPRRRLDRAMVAAAWGGAADADIVVLLVEAQRGLTDGVQAIIDALKERAPGRPVALAINKIDRVKAETLLALSQDLNAAYPFAKTFMISAEKGYGCDDLRDWLAAELPEGPWLYPEDQIADLPLRMIAAEITREKLTLRLHEEIPYQLTVETERWEDRPDGSARIDQIVYVARDGHKGIVLGKGGETLKAVGTQARAEIAAFLDRPVHLFLTVKVRPDWLEEKERFTEMGLEWKDGA